MSNLVNHSSKWASRILKGFCPDHLLEEIEGDLLQRFERDVKTHGERRQIENCFGTDLRDLLKNKESLNRKDEKGLVDQQDILALRRILKKK